MALSLAAAQDNTPAPPAVTAEDRIADDNEKQRYFLIRHTLPPGDTKPEKHGLLLILPGGPGSADFHPFCKNVLARLATPRDFLVAQLVAPVWREDANRTVWPSKSIPDREADFLTGEFIENVIDDLTDEFEIDDRFVFTLSWSSSGHAAYRASVDNDDITGSIIAMSRFIPGTYLDLDDVEDKNYFLYHSPADTVCAWAEAELAKTELSAHGANVKLAPYEGGHGWYPETQYWNTLKQAIDWLRELNAES